MLSSSASRGLVLLLAFAAGCSGDGRSRVTGKVTNKGQPLPSGLIAFIPEGAMSPAGGAAIVNGTYDISATPGLPAGKYKVSISAPTTKGAAKVEDAPGMSGPPPKETLPAKYNSATELRAEVKAGASNVFDFTLD